KNRRAEIDAEERAARRPLLPLEDIAAAAHGDPTAFDDPWKILSIHYAKAIKEVQEREREEKELRDELHERERAGLPLTPLGEAPVTDEEKQGAMWAVLDPLVKDAVLTGRPLPEVVTRLLPAARAQQFHQGIEHARGGPTVPADKTVAAHAEQWISRHR